MPDSQIVQDLLDAAESTGILQIKGEGPHSFNVFIPTGLVGTIDLEMRKPNEAAWMVIEQYTTFPVLKIGDVVGSWDVRLTVSTYTSGSVTPTLNE